MTNVAYYNQSTFHADDVDLENMKVNYVLPFSNHDNGGLMAIAALYAMLFMLGTCGNAAILAVVHQVRSMDARARHNTTLSYICILSIVDFVSMLPLPMTIIDQVLGFWMFGTFACKLFRLFEHMGKIFSTFILVCFSIDRYCAVCHPLQNRLRNPTTAYVMLCATFALTCILLCPILIYAQSKEIVVHEKYNRATNELTRLHLYKCVDDLGNELFILFTLTCFLFAYLVPLLLMIYFYYGMLMRLIKQSRTARKSLMGARRCKSFTEEKIPIARIAVYTLAICLFHFVCWTPYWVSVLYSLYLEVFQAPDLQMPDSSFIYFMYGVHALPYINSASNFILYGLLNRQLHQIPNQWTYRRGTMGRQSVSRNPPTLLLAEHIESFNSSAHDHLPTMNGGTKDISSRRISSASFPQKKFNQCVSPCSRHFSIPVGGQCVKDISQQGVSSFPKRGGEIYKEVDEIPLFDSDHKSALSFTSDDPDANMNEIKL